MFPFLAPHEIGLIRQDYRQMLASSDAIQVTLEYQSLLAGQVSALDEVYHRETSRLETLRLTKLPCLFRIVHERNLRVLAFQIVEVGDAIFYFPETLNLEEPVKGHPAVAETISFLEPQGSQWTPVLKDAGPLRRYLAMEFGGRAIAQVVPCTLRK